MVLDMIAETDQQFANMVIDQLKRGVDSVKANGVNCEYPKFVKIDGNTYGITVDGYPYSWTK